jgi:hypothetical protein
MVTDSIKSDKRTTRTKTTQLNAPENLESLTISVSSESILDKIKETVDKSRIGDVLYNAPANLGTCLAMLQIPSRLEDKTILILANVIFSSLFADPSLSEIQVDKGGGEILPLKDCQGNHLIEEEANLIKISNGKMRASASFSNDSTTTEITGIKAHYQIGSNSEKTININLTNPLNMKQIKAGALKYILEKQKNITPAN